MVTIHDISIDCLMYERKVPRISNTGAWNISSLPSRAGTIGGGVSSLTDLAVVALLLLITLE